MERKVHTCSTDEVKGRRGPGKTEGPSSKDILWQGDIHSLLLFKLHPRFVIMMMMMKRGGGRSEVKGEGIGTRPFGSHDLIASEVPG